MIKTKLFIYDSSATDYKGTELTQYILQGDSYNEDLTQEMDTAVITLQGYPIRKEFEPEYKFILEKYNVQIEQGQTNEELIYTYHICVEQDTVTQPILSNNNYFVHTISFTEASVIAQKRLVDNISATYKLKFVSLDRGVAFDLSEDAPYKNTSSIFVPANNFGNTSSSDFWYSNIETHRIGKYFVFEDGVKLYDANDTENGSNKHYDPISLFPNGAKFSLPKIAIYFGNNGAKTFTKIGYASLDWTIKEYRIDDYSNPTNTWTGTVESNSNFPSSIDYQWGSYNVTEQHKRHWLMEDYYKQAETSLSFSWRLRQYSNASATTPSYFTDTFVISRDRVYELNVSLHQYNNPLDSEMTNVFSRYIGNPTKEAFGQLKHSRFSATSNFVYTSSTILDESTYTATTEHQIYADDSVETMLTSANPYTALSLLQKAVVNTNIYKKTSGIFIAELNHRNANGVLDSPFPFYVDEKYIGELNSTQINENFYNQKNLWEVLVEIGNYIHAIPEIKFGENDKFMITFNKLGETNEYTNNATKSTITNFKGIDDYISATSSYISNMVQLGGQIEEYVCAKTSADNYLIYNDTAQLVTSMPIIELLNVQIICNSSNYTGIGIDNGETADFTTYIYEKNVYDILPIAYYSNPNRGISLYYELGDNKIQGGDYRTPAVNSGDYFNDYAFKKAIYNAYNGFVSSVPSGDAWTKIYISDFSFKITYRTKASVRQNQSRPDLRKYLLNCSWDKAPQHNQFNNQTDTLVDSEKFGNMVYGKLIRTGNTNYAITEWVNDLRNIKHKGELYRIDGDLYYVSKANHTFLADHVVSVIEYSKDYNQLTQIIGIPSEPRFYEISEQSSISRDISIDNYLITTTDGTKISASEGYIKDFRHLSKVLFGSTNTTENTAFAKYVVTTLKGDKDVGNTGDQTRGVADFYKEILLPLNAYSSQNTLTYKWAMRDNYGASDRVIATDNPDASVDPLFTGGKDNVYRSMQAVQYTDQYGKASLFDFYILEDLPTNRPNYVDIRNMPLNSMFSIRYLSVTMGETYGESQRYITFPNGEEEFMSLDGVYIVFEDATTIIHKISNGYVVDIVEGVPTSGTYLCNYSLSARYLVNNNQLSILATNNTTYSRTDYNAFGLSLLKDNREKLSFNYNIQMLTNTDQFVISPFLFEDRKTNVKLVLLNKEVNKLTYGYIDEGDLIIAKNTSDVAMDKFLTCSPTFPQGNYGSFYLPIDTTLANINTHHFDGTSGYEQVKAIAMIYEVKDSVSLVPNKYKFIMARNIPTNTTKAEAIKQWQVGTATTLMFTNKQ